MSFYLGNAFDARRTYTEHIADSFSKCEDDGRFLVCHRFESMSAKRMSFTFIDLFAGIGGLRRGFESIGGHCVFTAEWDHFSKQTYEANFPDNREVEGTSASSPKIPR